MAPNAGTATPPDDPLGFMNRLSDHIYLFRPSASTAPIAAASSHPAPPKLVIIATWMGARAIHIAKYLAPYLNGELFPEGPQPAILLIRSGRSTVFAEAGNHDAVQPAVTVIQGFLKEWGDDEAAATDAPPRVLVHIFSNGGCILLAHLYAALSKTQAGCLPPHVTVYDSSPGHLHYKGGIHMLESSVTRKPWLHRMAMLPIFHLLIIGHCVHRWMAERLFGTRHIFYYAWFPHLDRAGVLKNERRRAYFYSYDDRLINALDVEEHAADATACGFTVSRLVQFPGSGHVTHARTDGAKYWRSVREVWEET